MKKKILLFIVLAGMVYAEHIYTAAEWFKTPITKAQREYYTKLRNNLYRRMFGSRWLKKKRVLNALLSVRRENFCLPKYRKGFNPAPYGTSPLPINFGQTISGPYIHAIMTDTINPQPNEKVLEIGTGSGYQSAVLSKLTPHVYTIEVVPPLARRTHYLFQILGYNTITYKIDDGYFGWKEYAPFDKIIVTCSFDHIPPALIRQLKPGGMMLIPVGNPWQRQKLLKIIKTRTGKLRTQVMIASVLFVPGLDKNLKIRRK